MLKSAEHPPKVAPVNPVRFPIAARDPGIENQPTDGSLDRMHREQMKHWHELFERYPTLLSCRDDIRRALDILTECYERNGTVLLCGNGGSAADADHIVGELMKSFSRKREMPEEVAKRLSNAYLAGRLEPALRAIAVTNHTSLATAFANDVDPVLIFAQQVFGYGREGDVCWALSSSGNSMNVIYALQTAQAMGLKTIGLTGAKGGKMIAFCDVCIRVPEVVTYKVQELHLPIYHVLCLMLEERFFGIKNEV